MCEQEVNTQEKDQRLCTEPNEVNCGDADHQFRGRLIDLHSFPEDFTQVSQKLNDLLYVVTCVPISHISPDNVTVYTDSYPHNVSNTSPHTQSCFHHFRGPYIDLTSP